MDIFSCAASCFALLEVVKKLKEYASKIKNAQKEWQSYIFALDSLVHIQTEVDKLSKESLLGDDLIVEVRQQSLVSVCHSHLRSITEDAESMLQKFDQEEADYKQGRRWLKLRRFGRRLRFVIDAEKIQDHFQSVERAKSSLNLAIAIAMLRRNHAGHSESKGAVRDLGKSLQPAINGLITSFSAHSEDFKEFREKMRKSMRKMERPIVNHYVRHTAPDLGVERSRTPNSGHSNRKRRKRRKRATRRTLSTYSSQEYSNPPKPDSSSASPPGPPQCNESSSSLASNLSDKFAPSVTVPTRSLDGDVENSHGDNLSLFSRNATDISGLSGSGSNNTGTSYTSAIRMEGVLQAIVPDSTEIENCWRDSERNLQFCVDHLSEDDDGQLLLLKEPCTLMPSYRGAQRKKTAIFYRESSTESTVIRTM
ncbi:hypothetical protein BKA56DRAFT_688027 [Ilyonectria sp. MPI-CAGE-AT-0026]|nr:hypothetical protein BKA56DRAFT_688027 [Ilyonectria sp. MPI-CAGE-AT-0026]